MSDSKTPLIIEILPHVAQLGLLGILGAGFFLGKVSLEVLMAAVGAGFLPSPLGLFRPKADDEEEPSGTP